MCPCYANAIGLLMVSIFDVMSMTRHSFVVLETIQLLEISSIFFVSPMLTSFSIWTRLVGSSRAYIRSTPTILSHVYGSLGVITILFASPIHYPYLPFYYGSS